MKICFIRFAEVFMVCLACISSRGQTAGHQPVRLAVAGLTHGHVAFILDRKKEKSDILLTGIYEPDAALSGRIARQYGLDPGMFYTDLAKMLDQVRPEAVAAFGSIHEHMEVVEACAPRGIHVMVEKPLATSVRDAFRMDSLSKKYHVYILTDYETSWYPTTEKIFQLVGDSNRIGPVRKVIIHDGHEGPKEIGVSDEFLHWLTDPVQNGGGALIDFGCYGANLMTCLMKKEDPISVTASTRQFKPDIYPKVDDDATIIINYPSAQCIILASWNWPFGRKDMEVYGKTGYIISDSRLQMRIRTGNMPEEKLRKITVADIPVYEDPFSYFADVIRGKVIMQDRSLYSPGNNVWVVRILDAARESARTGKTILF